MDKIWYRNPQSRRSLAVVAGMKKTNDHTEPTKFERKKTNKVHLPLLYYSNIVFLSLMFCYLIWNFNKDFHNLFIYLFFLTVVICD